MTADIVAWTIGENVRTFARPRIVEAVIQRTRVKKPRKAPPVPLVIKAIEAIDDLERANVATEDTGDEVASIDQEPDDRADDEGEGVDGEASNTDGPMMEVGGEAAPQSESLEDLEEFDKGHLVALFLGGADNSLQIVPQVRGCNRDTWLQMEKTVYGLARTKASLAGTIGLALETGNTIAQSSLVMHIYVYYADHGGTSREVDPRIPVWFYVQLFLSEQPVAHFSIANQLRKRTDWPSPDEVRWFKYAHKKLGIPLPNPARLLIPKEVSEDEPAFRLRHYGDDVPELLDAISSVDDCYQRWSDNGSERANQILKTALSTESGPLRALQWLYNQGQCVHLHQMKPAAFEKKQIEIIRKYNLWVNGGTMLSDAAPRFSGQPWNAGEEADPFPTLDEAGGQAYPEVDHIRPKKKDGLNSYSNARLVSFCLNHIYREKPSAPPAAEEFGSNLRVLGDDDRAYRGFCARFSDDVLQKHLAEKTHLSIAGPDADYRAAINARRHYLETMAKLRERALKQAERCDDFEKVRYALYEGVAAFITAPPAELKTMMSNYAARLPVERHGEKQFGLHKLSDEIPALNTM